MLKNVSLIKVLIGGVFIAAVFVSQSRAAMPPSTASKISKAREHILKNERVAAMKIFKEAHREVSKETIREVDQAWREAAEVFFTDRGQSQFSMADSIWLSRPKDALDTLAPLQKIEFENLAVSRLSARAALRLSDCGRAETFVQQAEAVFPVGLDVKVLRLQVKSCALGTDAVPPELELPLFMSTDSESLEAEAGLRALAVKESLRRNDAKSFNVALSAWEARAQLKPFEDPEFWYLKWRRSVEASKAAPAGGLRDRNAARNYLRICTEMTPRRRKNFAVHPELCLHTETVESDLKSSDKAGS